MKKTTLSALLLAVCASNLSYAENSGWYMGGSLDGVFLNDADGEFSETDPGTPHLFQLQPPLLRSSLNTMAS